jgi:DHA1 family multidrug resistance protein-like MFS transporter
MGMGLIQTSQSIGNSLGPLLGSVGSALLGFKGTFIVSSAMMLLLVAAVGLFVREPERSKRTSTVELGAMQRLALIVRAPRLQAPIVATLTYQAAFMLSSTLVALHMEQLTGARADATFLVGLAFTVNALGLAVGGGVFGWLAGRYGDVRMSIIALLLMAAVTAPQTFVNEALVLVVLRALTGFAAGGVLPALRAHLGREASRDPATSNSMGAVYGVAQSAFAGGVTIGPALASLVAVTWGIAQIHLASGLLLVFTAAMYYWLIKRAPEAAPD